MTIVYTDIDYPTPEAEYQVFEEAVERMVDCLLKEGFKHEAALALVLKTCKEQLAELKYMHENPPN